MVKCGLISVNNEQVPLKSVDVDVQVKGHVATVTSSLRYVNEEDRPLEAVFVFPLPAECAICHFSAKLGDTEVVAKLQEKEKAREEYDDALSSGQQAFLLEESDESPDVFKLNVGSLPPAEAAIITLVYISELAIQADDALRFYLPAVLNPRYTPQDVDSSGMAPISSVPAAMVPYTLALKLQLSSPQPVLRVESNCSLQSLQYLNEDKTQAQVSLSPGHLFDRDVELLIYYQDSHQPMAIVEAGLNTAPSGTLMGDPAVMLSLYPEFPAAVKSALASCGEFIFVVDRSGSMSMHSGKEAKARIDSAKDTLVLLLKSLPVGCFFNIYGFGSRYEHFFPDSVEYNQKTMDEALQKVKAMSANMGGTEILQPLKHIYSKPCIPSHPRQLFVFTDGEVGNTKQVLDLVRANAPSHRCFSFGIGEGASTALITGLAKEGSGHAQFITGTDRMQPKVMQSLRYALQPAVKDVSVEWDLPEGVSAKLLSPPLQVLFHGQRALLYAQLSGERSGDAEGSVTVQYKLLEETIRNQLHFSLKAVGDTGLTLHRLGARVLLRSLEAQERDEVTGAQKEVLRGKQLELSLESGVSCCQTAFIAVHKSSNQAVQGPLLHRSVPTPSYGLQPIMCAMRAPPMMMMCSFNGPSGAPVEPQMMKKRGSGGAPKKRRAKGGGFSFPNLVPNFLRGGRSKPTCEVDESLGDDVAVIGSLATLDAECMEYCADTLDDDAQCIYDCADTLVDYAELYTTKDPSTPTEPLLQMISLQKARGSWEMDAVLAKVLMKTDVELANALPDGVDKCVWATIVALIWLHGFQMKTQDEWQFVAMKAASWIQDQKVDYVSKCVKAGNTLLGCDVKQETLGL